jgi:predicted homoserine dehydrogenase-like protein
VTIRFDEADMNNAIGVICSNHNLMFFKAILHDMADTWQRQHLTVLASEVIRAQTP